MTAPSRARRTSAKKVDFFWFQGESVAELTRRLNVAGPAARFHCRYCLSHYDLVVGQKEPEMALSVSEPNQGQILQAHLVHRARHDL